ncbi:hypothetical protein LCGC14_1739480, partial [marine sediment metagenome]
MGRRFALAALLCVGLLPFAVASAADIDEFKVKREAVFEFAARPAVTRAGDRVSIRFATKAFCDVTVAIEDAQGRILRHLASGVLGRNAPPPLQRDSKTQTLIWDGKDDAGRYVDDKDRLVVRVSLGLRARFERTLFWSPMKRWSAKPPLIQARPEGVYVFDHGRGASQLRLYDHRGAYVRTIYPFPADKLASFKDLHWYDFPQDGRRLPRKRAFLQCTLLSSGTDSDFRGTMGGGLKHSVPDPAKAMAVHEGRIALANVCLNRFSTAGASMPLPLKGPVTSFNVKRGGLRWRGGEDLIDAGPTSMAFSPDGRWLYMTAYEWVQNWGTGGIHTHWLNGVTRVRFDGRKPVEVFLGSVAVRDAGGTDPGKFRVPASVTCDAKGRIYVADNLNDRVQVFSPDRKLLKILKVPKPVRVAVHPRTGKVYVLSWLIRCSWVTRKDRTLAGKLAVRPGLFVLPGVDDAGETVFHPLPSVPDGLSHTSEIDLWPDRPTIWLVPNPGRRMRWKRAGIRLIELRKGKLVEVRDFGAETVKAVTRAAPPGLLSQRLYVN